MTGVVIVGAGQAGFWVAKTLRDRGYALPVTLVGDELHLPYERPPLSKSVLQDDAASGKVYLADAETLALLAVECRTGLAVTAIRRSDNAVQLSDGSLLKFDHLVLATGGRARTVSIDGDAPIAVVRTLDDALALRPMLQRARRVLVIGGGWIGLEIAATAAQSGTAVTVVEAGSQLCGRMLPVSASADLLRLHEARGVEVHLSCTVERIVGGVARLSNGATAACDVVVAGIGMVPNVELAVDAGLDVADGILVDASGRTSDPAIFAAGDVARFPSTRTTTGSLRLESWANAMNGGIAVAKVITGADEKYDPLPWFWSDQHGMNIQIVGLPYDHHRHVLRGSPEDRSYSHVYMDDAGCVAAAVSFNQPRENRIFRKMIEEGKVADSTALADPATDLMRLARGRN